MNERMQIVTIELLMEPEIPETTRQSILGSFDLQKVFSDLWCLRELLEDLGKKDKELYPKKLELNEQTWT